MSSAPIAVARLTHGVSLVTVHVGPTWWVFQGTSTPGWRGPRATSEPVDCRVQAWTRLALGHVHRNVCERIGRATNPQGWEKGSPSETPNFFVAPFLVGIPAVQVTAAYSRHTQAYVGRTGVGRTRVVRSRTGSVRSTRFRLARFLRGSFLCGFCRGFRSCRGAG